MPFEGFEDFTEEEVGNNSNYEIRISKFFSAPFAFFAAVIPLRLLLVLYFPARLAPNFLMTFSFSSALAPDTAGNSLIHS